MNTQELSPSQRQAICNRKLYTAVEQGNLEACRQALRAGASARAVDDKGRTALHVLAERYAGLRAVPGEAPQRCDPETLTAIVRELAQAGCPLNKRYGTEENTALHIAAYGQEHEQSEAIMAALLLAGARSTTNLYNAYPLHHATCWGREQAITLLLSHTRNVQKVVKAADTTGYTPLHHAAFHKRPAKIRLFLQLGADPNIQAEGLGGGDYETPLQCALNPSPKDKDIERWADTVRAILRGGGWKSMNTMSGRDDSPLSRIDTFPEPVRVALLEGQERFNEERQAQQRAQAPVGPAAPAPGE